MAEIDPLGIDNSAEEYEIDYQSEDSRIISNILRQKQILIIGPEAMLKKKQDLADGSGDISILLDEQIELARRENRKDKIHMLYSNAWNKIEDIRKKNDIVDENLRKCIASKAFPLVFTICTDLLLERLMEEVWGKVRKFNFCDSDSLSQLNEEMKLGKPITKPTICYLYGHLDPARLPSASNIWVKNNDPDDAIERIATLIKMKDGEHKYIFDYINKRMVIAVGCRCDDWRFRFFWYALRGNTLGGKAIKSTVAYTLIPDNVQLTPDERDSSIIDDPLSYYLSQYRDVKMEPNSRMFLKRLNNMLDLSQQDEKAKQKLKETYSELLQEGRVGTPEIFISYASEDLSMAYRIYLRLVKTEHFKVWLDVKELHSGSEYDREIGQALNDCRIFMPLLGEQTAYDLVNGNFTRYYIGTEWENARIKGFRHNDGKSTPDKVTIPVIIGKYNLDPKEYHKVFLEKTGEIDYNTKELKPYSIRSFDQMDDIVADIKRILKTTNNNQNQ